MANNIYDVSYTMKKALYERIIRIFIAVTITIIVLNIILSFFIFPVRNKSSAMEPGIVKGGFEFVCPLFSNPDRGEVFLLQDNQGEEVGFFKGLINSVCSFVSFRQWKPFRIDNNFDAPHIRRVVGMPGDTIYLDRYDVYIMPRSGSHFYTEFELTESAYNITFLETPENWDSTIGAKGLTEKIVLGEDEYFVLGDNRTISSDSRLWGPVHKKQFIGRVVLQYFPFTKVKGF